MAFVELAPLLVEWSSAAIIVALAIPAITTVVGFLHGVYAGRRRPWRTIYGIAVHLSVAVAVVVIAVEALGVVLGVEPFGTRAVIVLVASVAGAGITLGATKRSVDYRHLPLVRRGAVPVAIWTIAAASAVAVTLTPWATLVFSGMVTSTIVGGVAALVGIIITRATWSDR